MALSSITTVDLSKSTVKWVKKSKSRGNIFLDEKLKWKEHIKEIKLGFVKKLNLLKLIDFPPTHLLDAITHVSNFTGK